MKRRTQSKKNAALKSMLHLVSLSLLLIAAKTTANPNWLRQESEHFTIIYRQPQAYLVPHILRSAEGALARLAIIFNYAPAEKIVLATFDFSDYGTAGASTVPQNFIRLEIEPFELGYEIMPFHDRIQWLMNHELVHILVNDQASRAESFSRSIFSRVAPEQNQPLSVGFSLLTNHSRYTPRWHQEGIASFLETWLSGGHGRALASFDEMYFRSLVLDDKPFVSYQMLEGKPSEESFLLGTLHYLYGTRFVAHLAVNYGIDKLMAWYQVQPGELYEGFEPKFAKTFGVDLPKAWREFVASEKEFQQENLRRLQTAALTPIRRFQKPLGWVTQPFVEASGRKVIFGHHQSHRLTALNRFDLQKQTLETVGTLPSPSMIQIASTAYDSSLQLLFYTTNNNQLYRDIWVRNLATGESRLLFENVRAGQLTVSPATHELWGIRHANGKAALVYSAYPYRRLVPVIEFEWSDALQHLAISPSGRHLAATLHQASGQQSLIVANLELLKQNGRFLYQTISAEGSPEFPSWSPDEDCLYWNAYTNGVSNIYRARSSAYVRSSAFRRNVMADTETATPEGVTTNLEGVTTNSTNTNVEALSHTLRGLFRPIHLSADSLFAFEFTGEGFIPVIIPNRPAAKVPALAYFGQNVVARNPQVTEWMAAPARDQAMAVAATDEYRGLTQLRVQSLIPVISGFQEQKVAGLYTRLADPLYIHDLTLEAGVSQFGSPRFHFKGHYEYNRKYRFELEHNAASFYDLFNQRKAGLIGTKATLGLTRYLKFDNPHKVEQTYDLSFHRGIKSIFDNTVAVTSPDFLTFETCINSKNTRRAIGSVDNERGSEWSITFTALGQNPQHLQAAGGFHAAWGNFSTWLRPHNVLHVKLAGGYLKAGDEVAMGRFYLGGFGNQYLENKEVKQYREAFHFPGVPEYSLATERFAKLLVENNLPPLRFDAVRFGQHALSHVDASVFAQALFANAGSTNAWTSLGAQVSLVFKHWFNLESTLSAGVAQAWHENGVSQERFISFKLLKNGN